MPDKKFKLRRIVETELGSVVDRLNEALTGKGLRELEPVIGRLGRGGQVPHWFNALCEEGVLPNLDGKTIGSILEMLFVGILETGILQDSGVGQLKVNPARGVDLPDLDLGIKSPSENYCTSEPFFSAYERLYGNESDCVILLTNYQTAKKNPPLRLQVKSARYLRGSEIADAGLCAIARMQRDWLVENDEGHARRVFQFLAYVNQSDWRAKQLVQLVRALQHDDATIDAALEEAKRDHKRCNDKYIKEDKLPVLESELASVLAIGQVSPRWIGILDQLNNWLATTLQEASRAPNEYEWKRLRTSDFDGKIGMSFALQWRYNFARLFPEFKKANGRGKRKAVVVNEGDEMDPVDE